MRSLRFFRESAGLTQTDVAEMVGTFKSNITDYERGKHKPRPERLNALAEAVGVTPHDFETAERVLDALAPKKENTE